MTNAKVMIGVALAMTLLACSGDGELYPSGDDVALNFEVVDYELEGAPEFRAVLTISNNGAVAVPGDWQLFFSFGNRISADSLPAGMTASHINGDLWVMEAAGDYEPVAPGSSREIPFDVSGWLTKETAAPAGPYFVFGAGSGTAKVEAVRDYSIEPFEKIRALMQARGMVPTAASRFDSNSRLELLPTEQVGRVVPTPVRTSRGQGAFEISAESTIAYEAGLASEAAILAGTLEVLLGRRPSVREAEGEANGASIWLETGEISDAGRQADAYRLAVSPDGIRITGSTRAGVFYGAMTLAALAPVDAWTNPRQSLPIEAVVIEDAPRFAYRGIHLDVSRNFHSVDTVKRLLELSSFYKLNRFHFHLSDDEGWRLAVADLPELVDVGARRGHTVDEVDHLIPSYGSGPDPDNSAGSGHYSRPEMVEMLRFATDRHIEVIPEIDLPGHARAAIKAMNARHARLTGAGQVAEAEQYLLTDPEDRSVYRSVQGWDDNVIDVCRESTYDFIERVVDEMIDIWKEAEAPLTTVHVGGDEVPAGVWTDSPSCAAFIAASEEVEKTDDLFGYFMKRVATMLAEKGLSTAGWEEIALAEKVHGGDHQKEPDPALLDLGLKPYVWNNVWGGGAEDLGYKLANTGYEVVLCPATNLYFDLAYDADPAEPGYVWAGSVDTRKAWEFVPFDLFKAARNDRMGNALDIESFAGRVRPDEGGRERILGIQGQLWAENSKSRDILEYQAFPKLLGLAERAWAARPAWALIDDTDKRRRAEDIAWNEFANRLGQRELPRLDGFLGGIAYRLPPPGVAIEDGELKANTAFPGLDLRVSTDGSAPGLQSPAVGDGVELEADVLVATVDGRGRASRPVIVPSP